MKVSSDNAAISFDLYSNLTYMAALAVGEPSRDLMLAKAITQDYKTGVYFRQVYLMTKRMGFEYARAFRMVARKAGADSIKNLLLRFAGAINSGVSEGEFLLQEAHVEAEEYNSSYLRSIETLAKWADAYAALLVSVTLVVVVAMVSTMLSPLGGLFLGMLTISLFFVTSFGVYIIFRTAPAEDILYQSRRGPPARRTARRLLVVGASAGVVLGLMASFAMGLGGFLVVFGFSLMPCGVFAMIDFINVGKIDKEVAPFLRSLGNITASLGSTLGFAMEKLDRRSLDTLDPIIRRLQVRLNRGIDPERSWEAFRDEAGSELLNRASRMFVDGTNLGGAPDKVGAVSSKYAMDIALLRDRRTVSSAPFAYLTIPLHFAMTALMVFILEIMLSFNARISEALAEMQANTSGQGLAALPPLPVFQSQDLTPLVWLTTAALISLTVANSLAPKFAIGGGALLSSLFAGVCCIMTGVNMIMIPHIASHLLLSGNP